MNAFYIASLHHFAKSNMIKVKAVMLLFLKYKQILYLEPLFDKSLEGPLTPEKNASDTQRRRFFFLKQRYYNISYITLYTKLMSNFTLSSIYVLIGYWSFQFISTSKI